MDVISTYRQEIVHSDQGQPLTRGQPRVGEQPGSLTHELIAAAQRFGSRVAVADTCGEWTYRDVHRAARSVAGLLTAAGVQRHDRVAIVGDRTGALVWTLLGIMRLGAVFCILDPSHPPARLRRSLQKIAPKLVVVLRREGSQGVPEWLLDDDAPATFTLPATHEALLAAVDQPPDDQFEVGIAAVGPDDAAYVGLTSGSTGFPRAIVGSQRPLSHFFRWYRRTFEFGPEDRFSAVSGLGHDPLLRDIFTPLLVGARVCFPDQARVGSPELAEWVAGAGITVMHGTPAHMDLMTSALGLRGGESHVHLPRLKYFFSGGDVLTKSSVERLYTMACNVSVVNFYGCTETPQAIAYFEVGKQRTPFWDNGTLPDRVPLGRGIDGVDLMVLDAALMPVQPGAEGEICVRTRYLALGYLDDPEVSARKFLPDPLAGDPSVRLYRTGDAGVRRADGVVEFTRRLDRMAKIRGFRIELDDVENSLRECRGIRQCVVEAEDDQHGQVKLVAYLVATEAPAAESTQVRKQLTSMLPSYMIPTEFVWLDRLPLTPSGKIDRKALGQAKLSGFKPNRAVSSPTGPTQRRLAKLWQEVLRVERVSLNDDFFTLGGTSILAAQLFMRIEQIWGCRLPVSTLLRCSRLADLAEEIDRPSGAAEWLSLVPIQPTGDRLPLYCVHGLFGDVLTFVDLADALGKDQPVFGLQARGLDGVQEPIDDIERIASTYIEEILLHQPVGPYQLLGFSAGGLIAYEMARQLTARGQQVSFLGILDEPVHGAGPSRARFRFEVFLANAVVNLPYWGLCFMAATWGQRLKLARERVRFIRRLGRQLVVGTRGGRQAAVAEPSFEAVMAKYMDVEDLAYVKAWPEYRRRVVSAHHRASANYRPGDYNGEVMVFRARRQPLLQFFEPDLGWSTVATGAVHVEVVRGSHHRMVEPPYVHELAARIRALLERGATQDGERSGWAPIKQALPRVARLCGSCR